MKKWGALAVAVLGAAVMLVSSAGAAPQSLKAQLSTRAGANLYLVQLGLSPRGFVIQRGDHNYAGPKCPGAGWNCTTAKRVLQISDTANHSNQVTCTAGAAVDTAGDCEIVQTSDGGDNTAECDQANGDIQGNITTGASQKCVIFQTTTGTGGNTANISQVVSTAPPLETTFVPPPPPATQNVTQYAGIDQKSQGGDNVVNTSQSVTEVATTGSGQNQNQSATQQLSVTQKSTTGNNSVENGDGPASQSLTENAAYNASDGAVATQNQNASSTSPNSNVGINQTSASGQNNLDLNQFHNLTETVTGSSSSVTQNQGTQQGGLNAVVSQTSSGPSFASETQNEHQSQSSPTGVPAVQTQYGPMWGDPKYDAVGNSSSSETLTQSSTQTSSPGGTQNDQLYDYCVSEGTCNGHQSVTQNGQPFGNGCNPDVTHVCDTGLIVLDQHSTTCNNDCPPQPPPPPPPVPPLATGPTCALVATIEGPPAKQIKIEVQDAQSGVKQIDATTTNATYTIDPDPYAGSTSPITVTATKTDQSQSSFIRLTITAENGDVTTCDPIVPASHKKAAGKAKHAKTHVAKAKGLTLRLSASGLVYGQPKQLTLTGTVPTGKAGEKVDLLTSTCGFKGAAKLATLKTGPGGVFRFSFAPALGAAYAVRWNGQTTAKKGIRVQPQIALVKVGNGRYRIDVSTTNGVFLTGTKVSLQALAGGHWKTLATGKLAPNSPVDVMTAVSSATVAGKGAKLRAVVPATACYSSAISN